MAQYLDIESFLQLASQGRPIVDVRSPAEFEHAHIPGALSLPLFDNDERAKVGTLYKQQGRVIAVQKGLEFVGPKLRGFTKFALGLKSPEILVHCWRGGMRSSSMAWLFERVDLNCYLLDGGYKAYRNHVLSSFEKPYKFVVLGGCTGSGKTDILMILREMGEQVLDLEGLANHKGSAFGTIGQADQPSSEFFEHLVFNDLANMDIQKRIWVEDESLNIGKVFIPKGIWNNMRKSSFIRVDTSYEVRLARIMRDYACFAPEQLAVSIKKIEKRLGSQRCETAYNACMSGDMETAARICLDYYDKFYLSGLDSRFSKNGQIETISVDSLDVADVAKKIINNENYNSR